MIKMLNNQLYNEYSRRGYVLSKSVIDEDQCDKLRKYIKSLIRKNPKSEKNIILHSKCIKDKGIELGKKGVEIGKEGSKKLNTDSKLTDWLKSRKKN